MEVRSFNQLIKHTCFKITRQFFICITILYLTPLLSVSVKLVNIDNNTVSDAFSSVFFNVFSWIYICISLIIIVSLNFRKMLKIIKNEMDIVYCNSMSLYKTDSNIKDNLTLKEFIETSKHIDKMQKKIHNMIQNERDQKEELIFKVTAASHDLKTPLTIIQGNSELMLYSDLNEYQKQCLTDIITASQQMKHYFNEFISYSKTFYDDKSEWNDYSISDVIKAVVNEACCIIKDKSVLNIINNVKIDRNININIHYIIRAVHNIINNSMEYSMSDNKKIEFKIDFIKNKLVFSIWNNGSSFSDEMIKNCGKLFYSQNKFRNMQNEHYGIGLAFVKRVVTLHNGEFKIANSKDGAEVIMSLDFE
ncbi:MAG: HAMP domain-containing histidine kinase [Lachnospiraceae bacterium]|nr:HAMP domain-containing histidine kinase [Lachnospiraceae bacterium]